MINETLKELLKNGVVALTFRKVDGTQRTMRCTLNERIIEDSATPYTRKTNKHTNIPEHVQRVFDLDQNAWRSFRWEGVEEFDAV